MRLTAAAVGAKVLEKLRSWAASSLEVGEGGLSFLSALYRVLQTKVLIVCLRHTPAMLGFVALVTTAIWLLFYPLRWPRLLVLEWFDAMQWAAQLTLTVCRLVLPATAGGAFFGMLDSLDPPLGESIRQQPVLYGPRQQAAHFARMLVIAVVVIAIAIALVVFALHFILVLIVTWWFWLTLFAVGLVLGAILGSVSWGYMLLEPFMLLWEHTDPVVLGLAVVMFALGIVDRESLGGWVRSCVGLYFTSSVLTAELLAHYSQRQQRNVWHAFKQRHRWRCLGFGLPLWALARYCPLAVVLLLQVLMAAAASFLKDLINADLAEEARGRRQKLIEADRGE